MQEQPGIAPTPLEFASDTLGVKPWSKQEEVLGSWWSIAGWQSNLETDWARVSARRWRCSGSPYQVWLSGDGDKVLVGQMIVDPSGWGATTIYLENSITDFKSVEVTTQREDGLNLAPGIQVLEATFGGDSD